MTTGLVTGAAGGIGSACVRALAGSAELIVLSGRRVEALERVAAGVDGRTAVVTADLTTGEGRDAVLAAIEGSLSWVVLASGVPARKPLAELDARVPLARAGTPDEVAQLVRYLILEAPPYLTGARIAIDGGAETVG